MLKLEFNKGMINKIIFFVVGMLVMTFGARMLLYSGIGTSGMDALSVGVANLIGVSIGLAINIVGVVLVLISAMLRKSRINIFPILTPLVFGTLFDMWSNVVFCKLIDPRGLLNQISVLMLAIVIGAMGTAIYMIPKFPVSTLDYFMLSIQVRFKTSLQNSRIIVEIVLLLSELVVLGLVGLGTFIIMIIFGPILQISYKYLEKILEKSNFILN